MTNSKDEKISEEILAKWEQQRDDFDKARLEYIARLPLEQREAVERCKNALKQASKFTNKQIQSNNEDIHQKTILMESSKEKSSSNYLKSSLNKARSFLDKIR